MKITLLHPSRGRAEKAKNTYDFWMENRAACDGIIDVEHILSIDNDDPEGNRYLELFFNSKSKIVQGANDFVVGATNNAAILSTGQILVYLSDDFKCPNGWDVLLADKFKSIDHPALIKVDDDLQRFEIPVLTIPIMNRQLYEKLGYFWYPEYKSMFVDEDLYWTCHNNNWLINAPDLKFPHEHPCNNKCESDETYKRSEANWNQGEKLYFKRKSEGFPL